MKNTQDTKNSENYDVIIIGGGASGMMASCRAGECGKKVLLIEKNNILGKKLRITGGGRCNITNAEDDIHVLLKNYGKSSQFLYSAFSQFGVSDTFSFFEKLGLPIVVQARKRAFPHTEKAEDVANVLEKYLKQNSVTVLLNTKVNHFTKEGNRITGVVANGKTYIAPSYIISAGGLSHPETGSTGDGFSWLQSLGHTIVSPTPTIVPLMTKEEWGHSLSGVSLSFMKITFFVDGVKKVVKKGKLLFTHVGISGPLILNTAGAVGDLMHSGIVTALIDAYPDTDHKALEEKIISIFDKNKNKMIKNIIDEIVPHGMSEAIFMIVKNTDPQTKVHSVTKEQRKNLVQTLKALPLTISGLLGYDKAVVADGGVPLNEIDTKTMRSLRCENLFITGDLLHINRPSGGYSLQLCWTTGFVAGDNV